MNGLGRVLWGAAILALAAAACGGGSAPGADQQPGAPAPAKYLAGLHAADLAKVIREKGLVCKEPVSERDGMHWVCEAQTPLIGFFAEYWGRVPGRLEYIKVVVTQSKEPKVERVTALLDVFTKLRYQGAEPAKARDWIAANLEKGGQQMFGSASYKLSGDLSRIVLEIKAPGSDW